MDMKRVRTIGTGVGGSPYYTNHYFGDGLGDAQECVNQVANFWNTMLNFITTDLDITVLGTVAIIDSVTGDQVGETIVAPENLTGTSPGQPLPPANQGLVRWRTNNFTGSRRVMGKTFIPGMTVANTSEGQPTQTLLGTLTSAAQDMAGSSSTDLVVWSKTKGIAAPVSGGDAWNKFAVLRSRRD